MFVARGLPSHFHALFKIGLDVLSLTLFSAISLLLYIRRGDDFMALYTGLMMMLTAFIYANSTYSDGWVMWLVVLMIALGETMQVGFFYLFPSGRFFPRWSGWLLIPLLIFRYVIWANIYINHVGQGALEVGLVVLLMVIGFVFQWFRFQKATPTQRQQVKFMLFGLMITVPIVAGYIFVVGIAQVFGPMNADNYFLLNGLRVLQQLALFLFPTTIMLSILRFRLWNIDLALNRSMVFGALTATLALIFAAVFFVLRAVLGVALGSSGPQFAGVGAALITGLTFNPVRRGTQDFIDRRIFNLRFNLNELKASQKPMDITDPGHHSGQLLGPYRVGGLIGKGGMGEVYLGEHGGHKVAIKVISQMHEGKDDLRMRFSREARTTLNLSHPHIVQTIDYGELDGNAYMVMDFVDGPELSAAMRERAIWPEDQAIAIIIQVAQALEYAHKAGFVHRDIKPSNIMLRPSATGQDAVLMDFGVAKALNAQTLITGTGTVGTIDYMAPEQIKESQAVDHRVDIYALGLVLYELLAGEKAFSGTAAQVMFAHLQKPAPDVRDLNPTVTSRTARVIRRALAKDPEDRFASAGEFAAALSD
jgi:predicted Ser/Thr protein kinase